MGVAVGQQTVFGLVEETTYGAAAVPSRFHEISQESLALSLNKIRSNAMRPGGYNPRLGSREVISSRSAAGDFKVDVTNRNMGLLLKHIMGPALTPTVVQQGGTTAYLHTYLLGLSGGKSLTLQKQLRDNTGAVVAAFDYPGSKIAKAEFTIGTDSMLELNCSVDSRNEAVQGSPAVSSFPATRPFYFAQGLVKLAGTQVTDIIRDASVTIERPMDTDRRGLGNAGLKSEQTENDFPAISGKMSSEFSNLTNYNRFNSNAALEFVLEFVGANIAGAYNEMFRITIPEIHIDGESPKVGGPDTVKTEIPFTGFFDGTNPAMRIEYLTADTAV